MGTYTTNYNLFMPTVGEQGWGELVNENFTTIDTTMAGLNTRLTAVENEVNGNLNCTSVTTSGTITSTGKITANGGVGTTSLTTSSTITSTGLITANGGVKGNLTGNVTGNATTATNLSRTVTVAASSTTMVLGAQNDNAIANAVICPYTPGVLYTGKIKAFVGSTSFPGKMYTLSSSNGWSTTSINTTSAKEYSITNVKSVIVAKDSIGNVTLYLPTFT